MISPEPNSFSQSAVIPLNERWFPWTVVSRRPVDRGHAWAPLQCGLARAKGHTSQERKIRHIHRGVRKTVCVHSTTIPLSSVKFIW